MPDPTITYGPDVYSIPPDAQYLLMEAELKNGSHEPDEFIEALNGVSLDRIMTDSIRTKVDVMRSSLNTLAKNSQIITIDNFVPDWMMLCAFVDATKLDS